MLATSFRRGELVLLVLRWIRVPAADGVGVADLSVAPVNDDLGASGRVASDLLCRLLGLRLSRVERAGALSVLGLVGPLAIRPPNDVPTMWVWCPSHEQTLPTDRTCVRPQ